MRPLRDIKRFVGCAEVHSIPKVNKAVLDGLMKEFATTRSDASLRAGRNIWSSVVHSPLAQATAVAALIVIGTLVVVSRTPRESTRRPPVAETLSVADMLTVGRLNAACRRGGLPEVERQCEQAAQKLQNRPERISMEQLIREMKGT